MGKYRRLVIASVMGLYIQKSQGQQNFATIEKNVNIRAKDLIHDLNKTKDTLILQSGSLINKVYSVSTDYEREVDMVVNDTHIKIPLNQLSKGKHVFVAVQSPIRIVFVVKVFRDNEWLLAMQEERLALKNEKK